MLIYLRSVLWSLWTFESHPVYPPASTQHSCADSPTQQMSFRFVSDSPREGDFSSSLVSSSSVLAHHTHHQEVLTTQLKRSASGSLQFAHCEEVWRQWTSSSMHRAFMCLSGDLDTESGADSPVEGW